MPHCWSSRRRRPPRSQARPRAAAGSGAPETGLGHAVGEVGGEPPGTSTASPRSGIAWSSSATWRGAASQRTGRRATARSSREDPPRSRARTRRSSGAGRSRYFAQASAYAPSTFTKSVMPYRACSTRSKRRDDLASALELIQKVWSEQEGMLAAFLERRENAAAAKPKKRGGPRPAPRKSR